MSSNHNQISQKIYESIKETENNCNNDCEVDHCLVCFIKKYLCECGMVTNTKCYYCKKYLCINCEYIDNSKTVCKDCFSEYY